VEWSDLLKPFVSDLADPSSAPIPRAISFTPRIICQAALLFVDMSGYSKINAVAHRRPRLESSVVNAYLERLLQTVTDTAATTACQTPL
jgi:6-phosphogluconolactonase/glucosamine-6-phosphate isomerase/deaminase